MAVLSQMASMFRLATSGRGASADEINALRDFFRNAGRSLPQDYVELLLMASEVEIIVEGTGCIRFWSPEGVRKMNEVHALQSYITNGVAIGGDEGEAVYVLMNGVLSSIAG